MSAVISHGVSLPLERNGEKSINKNKSFFYFPGSLFTLSFRRTRCSVSLHQMPRDIFISYSRKDSEQALTLAEKLRADGIQVWIDKHGIIGAEKWATEIVEGIKGCSTFILLISGNSVQSENVLRELSLASKTRKRILPVEIERIELPSKYSGQLTTYAKEMNFRISSKVMFGSLVIISRSPPTSWKLLKIRNITVHIRRVRRCLKCDVIEKIIGLQGLHYILCAYL